MRLLPLLALIDRYEAEGELTGEFIVWALERAAEELTEEEQQRVVAKITDFANGSELDAVLDGKDDRVNAMRARYGRG